MLFAKEVGRIRHVADRVEEFDSVGAVGHDQGPIGMTVADDLKIELMFGLALMTVVWMKRHFEIRLGAIASELQSRTTSAKSDRYAVSPCY